MISLPDSDRWLITFETIIIRIRTVIVAVVLEVMVDLPESSRKSSVTKDLANEESSFRRLFSLFRQQ